MTVHAARAAGDKKNAGQTERHTNITS
jgi:hypothetical protein